MGVGDVFSGLADNIGPLFSRLGAVLKAQRRLLLIAAAGLLVIIILLIILAVKRSLPPRSAAPAEEVPLGDAGAISPAEDFFLPYEPDFVPGVLLEREPRDGWSEEDARPFWTDPAEGNEEAWRRRIESGVDAILEKVP
ncbi:MAG: hypothetical protein LBG84_10245 [Treponema sp.]|jgi:hypothetical protein|nr:hypothetical protein [Treponema sp.]